MQYSRPFTYQSSMQYSIPFTYHCLTCSTVAAYYIALLGHVNVFQRYYIRSKLRQWNERYHALQIGFSGFHLKQMKYETIYQLLGFITRARNVQARARACNVHARARACNVHARPYNVDPAAHSKVFESQTRATYSTAWKLLWLTKGISEPVSDTSYSTAWRRFYGSRKVLESL